MKIALIALGVVFGILALFAGVLFASYVSAYNLGNNYEKVIVAQYKNNQNILSSYYNKIEELVQVPSMYKDDFKEIVTASMQGRYGADGSRASFQWLKEHNINFDASLYKNIQQNIEAGRNEFQQSQTMLLDKRRQYETDLGTFWTGMWLRLAGYPKIDLSKYDIIVSDKASEAFASGKENSIKLRK